MHNVVNIDSDTKQLTRIYPGDEVLFHIPEPGELHTLRYELDEVRLLEVSRVDDGFKASIPGHLRGTGEGTPATRYR